MNGQAVHIVNNTAYTLLGMILLLMYQRLHAWWLGRKNRAAVANIPTNAWFGWMLMLFAIATTLFYVRQDIQETNFRDCQTRIQDRNIVVQQNNSAALLDQLNAEHDLQYSQLTTLTDPAGHDVRTQLIDGLKASLKAIDKRIAAITTNKLQPINGCTAPKSIEQG